MSSVPLPPDLQTQAADLFRLHRDAVAAQLSRRFPGTDPVWIADAVVDAILDLSQHPERFDSAKGTVPRFLYGAARRLLLKWCRRDERRRLREEKYFAGRVTNSASAGRDLVEQLIKHERLAQARAFLVRADEERPALDLWLRGDDDPAQWALALNLLGRDQAEVQVRADKVRARFRQRLHRFWERLAREDQEP